MLASRCTIRSRIEPALRYWAQAYSSNSLPKFESDRCSSSAAFCSSAFNASSSRIEMKSFDWGTVSSIAENYLSGMILKVYLCGSQEENERNLWMGLENSRIAGWGLAQPRATTTEAAPAFVVFEGWAPRTRTPY